MRRKEHIYIYVQELPELPEHSYGMPGSSEKQGQCRSNLPKQKDLRNLEKSIL